MYFQSQKKMYKNIIKVRIKVFLTSLVKKNTSPVWFSDNKKDFTVISESLFMLLIPL